MSTKLDINNIEKAKVWLKNSDAVLITASNGLSIAEGYHIFADNEPYKKYFGKFREKYGTNCLIHGVFTPMTEDDHKEYMKIVHKYLIDDYNGSQVMKNLLKIVSNKTYFIVTCNCDTHFKMNGFKTDRIFEVEGNFDGMDEGSEEWQKQKKNFLDFVHEFSDKNVILFELGIGSRNRIVKAPTMQLAAQFENWKYITMNMPQEIHIPHELTERAIAITGDIGENFQKLLK